LIAAAPAQANSVIDSSCELSYSNQDLQPALPENPRITTLATSSVFSIFEILEQILLHVVSEDEWTSTTGHTKYQPKTKLRDSGRGITFLFVSGCRVNKYWNETITKSAPLQQAMFLQRNPSQRGLLVNPLIGRIAQIVTSPEKDDKDFKSWHKMLVVQTLKLQVALHGKHMNGGGYYTTYEVSFAGDVRMDVFATWIANPRFAVVCQKLDEHKTPVLDLEFDNCMQRGTGEVSYEATSRAGGR
jgi:hypothetical protein